MYIDKQLTFSSLQGSITTSAASENYVDLGVGGDAYDKELYIVARVGTAFANATSMSIDIQTDDNTSFSSPDTIGTSGAIAEADLTTNTIVYKARLPKGLQRYLRVFYTVDGTHNAGTIDCFLTTDIPQSI
jgi:hypothetical protein